MRLGFTVLAVIILFGFSNAKSTILGGGGGSIIAEFNSRELFSPTRIIGQSVYGFGSGTSASKTYVKFSVGLSSYASVSGTKRNLIDSPALEILPSYVISFGLAGEDIPTGPTYSGLMPQFSLKNCYSCGLSTSNFNVDGYAPTRVSLSFLVPADPNGAAPYGVVKLSVTAQVISPISLVETNVRLVTSGPVSYIIYDSDPQISVDAPEGLYTLLVCLLAFVGSRVTMRYERLRDN